MTNDIAITITGLVTEVSTGVYAASYSVLIVSPHDWTAAAVQVGAAGVVLGAAAGIFRWMIDRVKGAAGGIGITGRR